MAYTKYSLTPANNNAAPPDGAPEGMLPSAVNDTMRDMMAQIRDVGDGIRGGTYTMTAPVITGGSVTGSTINNSAIGGTTAAAGKFTTLEATGVTTVQAGTVSAPAITTTGDTNTGIFFPAADTIAFTEGGVESMRIDSSGNVGIGTSSPAFRLDVGGQNGTNIAIRSTGTSSAILRGYVNSAESGVIGFLNGGGQYFETAGTERMRIDSSGNLLVGTTSNSLTSGVGLKMGPSATVPYFGTVGSDTSNNNSSYYLYSTGAGAFRFYVGYGGTIFATSIVISAISDERLKENIKDIDTGIDTIMALKPRRFDWKDGKGQDKKNVAGFIAQEFEKVFPECVSLTKAGEDGIEYKNINHETLIPTLVKAIQELNAKVTALENQLGK